MLDETIISQPTVKEAINNPECIISGGFTDASETGELAALINSGNLPFSIKDVELSSIGPTLGEEALTTSLTNFAKSIAKTYSKTADIVDYMTGEESYSEDFLTTIFYGIIYFSLRIR